MNRQFDNTLQLLTLFLMASVLALLGACATQSTAFNDRAADASVTMQWATGEATKLGAAGVISKAQLTSALDASKAGTLAINTAKDLSKAGKATDAEAQLAMASTILNSLKTFLLAYGVKQ